MEQQTIKKVDLSTKSVMIYDHGNFSSLAERLSKDFKKVYYYSPWKNGFPNIKLTYVGKGLGDNIERVNDFFDYVDQVDLIVFPDVINGDLQVHLESLGYRVWGSRKGEELELNRIANKQLLEKLKLPVGPYEIIKGIDKLRKYLKTHKDVFVKIDIFRGDFETFKSINYDYSSTKLDQLEKDFAALKNEIMFIVEEELPDKVELAYDGYTVDGEFPTKTLCGIEIKALGYIGVVKDYNKLPEPVRNFNEKISPILKNYHYRNFFSPEMRVGKDGKGYMIDVAARFGSPPSEVYQDLFTNLSEIFWYGADGILIDPIPKNKYAVQIQLHSTYVTNNYLNVQFKDKYKENLKFKYSTVIDGERYIIPVNMEGVGAIVTTGDSIQQCMDKINEIGDSVKAFYLDVPTASLDKAKEQIEKLKEMGYDLFK